MKNCLWSNNTSRKIVEKTCDEQKAMQVLWMQMHDNRGLFCKWSSTWHREFEDSSEYGGGNIEALLGKYWFSAWKTKFSSPTFAYDEIQRENDPTMDLAYIQTQTENGEELQVFQNYSGKW